MFKYKKSIRVPYFSTLKLLLSDLGLTNSLIVKNCVGEEYKIGDRIGQIIILPHPQIEFEEAEELSETERGNGGYGSTGN